MAQVCKVSRGNLVLEVITEPWLWQTGITITEGNNYATVTVRTNFGMALQLHSWICIGQISALQCSSIPGSALIFVWVEGPAVSRVGIVNFIFLQKTVKLKSQTQVWKLFTDSKFVFCSISFGCFVRENNDRF